MISGLIIYSKADQEKNTWFIEKCIQSFKEKGVSLMYTDEMEISKYLKDTHISFAIYRGRDYEIVKRIERKGIRCFNNALTNKIANDKWLSYKFLKDKEIPVLPTFSSLEEVGVFSSIMKSVDGHGGQEVYLINSLEEEKQFKKQNKRYVYQKYYQNDGDLRLYVLNKQVIGAVYRHSKNDFKSNYSLGGEVSIYQPEPEIVGIAIKVATLLNADYIGVDFIKVNNKWCVNEIEDPVGARMLYKTTNIDVVKLFVDYVSSLVMVN